MDEENLTTSVQPHSGSQVAKNIVLTKLIICLKCDLIEFYVIHTSIVYDANALKTERISVYSTKICKMYEYFQINKVNSPRWLRPSEY